MTVGANRRAEGVEGPEGPCDFNSKEAAKQRQPLYLALTLSGRYPAYAGVIYADAFPADAGVICADAFPADSVLFSICATSFSPDGTCNSILILDEQRYDGLSGPDGLKLVLPSIWATTCIDGISFPPAANVVVSLFVSMWSIYVCDTYALVLRPAEQLTPSRCRRT
jgi:hypothetical protein